MTRTKSIALRWGTGLLLATAMAGSAFAGARDSLESFTSGLKGLDGDFRQQVYDARGQLRETSSGSVQLSVPSLFRWEYKEPYPQLIVADGENVWIHEPDLEQVTVRPQGAEEANSPLAALVDPQQLDRRYEVVEQGSDGGLEWLRLTPKAEDGSFSSARLGFKGQQLARMELVDAIGQKTLIEFTGWTRNPGFAAGTFTYTPPAGVDVLGEP